MLLRALGRAIGSLIFEWRPLRCCRRQFVEDLRAFAAMASSSTPPNLLSSFLACKEVMPVAAMLVSPGFDLHEAMMAPELCNAKMDPALISKQAPPLLSSKTMPAAISHPAFRSRASISWLPTTSRTKHSLLRRYGHAEHCLTRIALVWPMSCIHFPCRRHHPVLCSPT